MTTAETISRSPWRWASIVLALAIAALRRDVPVQPALLLTAYFLVTALVLRPRFVQTHSYAVAALDVVMLTVCTLIGGGERSPLYIVYLTTALDIGTRLSPWPAGAMAVLAGFGYTAAAWGASQINLSSFDPMWAITRGFLFVTTAVSASSLSQTAAAERQRAGQAESLSAIMRLTAGAGSNMPELLDSLIKQLCSDFAADLGVAYVQGDGQSSAEAAAYGLSISNVDLLAALAAGTCCAEAGGARVPHVPQPIAHPALSALRSTTSSAMCTQMILESRPLGCLWLARTKGRAFSPAETHLLALMGQHAALAVRQARLHTLERRALSDLQAAEKTKSEFLSNVSHELRTPLTAIKASAGLLLDERAEAISPTQHRLLRSIVRNTDRLAHLVGDLLDMARLQDGRLPLTCTLIDVRSLARASVVALQPLLDQKEQTVDVHLPQDLARIIADRRRIEQVITNLLSNAHAYTPRGGQMAITAINEGDSIRITVSDNGPGIPADEQDLVFRRFYRGAGAQAGQNPGAGLGLSIARSLVELHGGSLFYRAAPGGGSAFDVTLPVRGPAPRPSAGPGEAEL